MFHLPTVRMRLSELALGDIAAVVGYESEPQFLIRFMEMGLTLGAQVQMLAQAPIGGPLLVWVRGTRLCLSKKEAELFFIEHLVSL